LMGVKRSYHRKTPSTDPIVFMPSPWAWSAYQLRVFQLRRAIFACFHAAVPCDDKSITDDEYSKVFTAFIHHFFTDVRVSYGYFSWIIHVLLVYWGWQRILYCPQTANSFSWSPQRPPSLVDFSQLIQSCFYTATFISHLFSHEMESFCLVHVSYYVHAALTVTFWTVPNNGSWILSGGKRYSTFSAVYLPFLFWWIYNVCVCNRMGLAYWESIEQMKQNHYKNDIKSSTKLSTKIQRYIPSDKTFIKLVELIRRIWMSLTPIVFVITYRVYQFSYSGHVYKYGAIDVPYDKLPGAFMNVFYCLVSSGSLFIWMNYLVCFL
jgi:hypothetical protein